MRGPGRGAANASLLALGVALALAVAAPGAAASGDRSPSARPDAVATREDVPLAAARTRDVLANDRDPEGDRLVARAHAGPEHGTLELAADGTFAYSPERDYHGPDAFEYRACERDRRRSCSRPARVSISVSPVNDAPLAAEDRYETEEDAALTVASPGPLGNDTDVEGTPLSARVERGPEHGTLSMEGDGSFTYVPRGDWTGTDSFLYAASDGEDASAPAEVRVSVSAANDAPVAQGDRASTPEDTAVEVAVLANDEDPDGEPLRVASYEQPDHGRVSCGEGACAYVPDPDYNGADGFVYTVTDGRERDTATVAVGVEPVDDAPVATIDLYAARAGETLRVEAPGVLANDHDADGDALSVLTFNQPRHGQLTLRPDGSFSFRPERGFAGTTSFTYGVSDGAGPTASATVSVRVGR